MMCRKMSESTRVYSMTAVDRSLEAATHGLIANPRAVPKDVNETGGLCETLKLCVGARVML